MKLVYHKIKGVDKSICTAEQKIAYEIAFRLHISYQDRWDEMRSMKAAESAMSNAISDLIGEGMAMFDRSKWSARMNQDAVFAALNAGLRSYLDKFFIATNYEQIGLAFPANYL